MISCNLQEFAICKIAKSFALCKSILYIANFAKKFLQNLQGDCKPTSWVYNLIAAGSGGGIRGCGVKRIVKRKIGGMSMEETKGGCRLTKELKNDFEKACLFEKPIENLEEYIDKVKKIRDKADSFLSFVERRYVECPLCGKQYWIFDYDIYKKDILNEEMLYARCPQDHVIRLGNNKYIGWKDERLEEFQIDWFIERMKRRCEEWS